jgi:hypothetical protein
MLRILQGTMACNMFIRFNERALPVSNLLIVVENYSD